MNQKQVHAILTGIVLGRDQDALLDSAAQLENAATAAVGEWDKARKAAALVPADLDLAKVRPASVRDALQALVDLMQEMPDGLDDLARDAAELATRLQEPGVLCEHDAAALTLTAA